ncbi:hypothetical protein [Kutzneria sp. NPDC052558]|uniref:hypothetical protein n=1 Tax=Kutzneria sp. NPDC052558 TaxID=3364121 RepID=UPI0037CAC478
MAAGPTSLTPRLQSCVDRFAKALVVPAKLMSLHPRRRGNPGKAAALAPAITLGVLSAFEGYVEDVLATAFYLQQQSFGQIAKKLSINNPDVEDMERLVLNNFPTVKRAVGVDVTVDVRKVLPHSNDAWVRLTLNWNELKQEAGGWMQVRHCLTHGLVSGASPEVWPAPLRADKPHASTVLRHKRDGRHSLNLNGAISCARIYITGGQHLGNLMAAELGQTLSWKNVPDFAQFTPQADETAAPRSHRDGHTETAGQVDDEQE